jgi:hypothetical protein
MHPAALLTILAPYLAFGLFLVLALVRIFALADAALAGAFR